LISVPTPSAIVLESYKATKPHREKHYPTDKYNGCRRKGLTYFGENFCRQFADSIRRRTAESPTITWANSVAYIAGVSGLAVCL
jgi:hypothetical protein